MPNQNTIPIKAIAVFNNNQGYVTFTENIKDNIVVVDVFISGLSPGEHGIHIHEAGNLLDGCKGCCAHFNPDKTDHGSPLNSKSKRHVGDLGNIKANKNGEARSKFIDDLIKLRGSKYNIIGRSVVIHEDADDLGLGVDDKKEESLKTGNAGKRVLCGVIGYAEPYYI